MKLKMKVGVLLVTVAMGFSSVVNAGGIPTFDAVQKATALKQLQEAVTTVQHLQSQIDQMKAQYKAITGSRNLGEILTNTGLKSALPADWQKVYSSIQSGGYKGLDGAAKAIADAAHLADRCKTYKAGSEQQKTCQTAAVQSAQTQSNIMQALENAGNRLENLNQLARKINSATDPKAIQDLTARIGIEQAAIQNEQTRLQLFMKLADIQEKNAQQAARAARVKRAEELNSQF
jgi:P-type DNA transfer protein VirB5